MYFLQALSNNGEVKQYRSGPNISQRSGISIRELSGDDKLPEGLLSMDQLERENK